MANVRRSHRDRNTETEPERFARLRADRAEQARLAEHYARQAEQAKRLAERLRNGR